jgi:two-component system sensor histidine kinase BarA
MSINLNILIVDDNIINRQYFTMSLKKHGYQSVAVESGFDAIEMVNKHTFNLILMDIRMPGMDGYKTTKHIRQISGYELTPIVATSAENIKSNYQSLFNEFLLKPISPSQLLQTIIKHTIHTPSEHNNIFNKDSALKYAYNDLEIMQKLLTMFIQDLPLQFDLLNKNFGLKKYKSCCAIIHKIRGSCKACGADHLDQQLQKLTSVLNTSDDSKKDESMIKTNQTMDAYRRLIMTTELIG